MNTMLGLHLIGNKQDKFCWFCGDALEDLVLVSFSLVNMLSGRGCWLLHPASSISGSLFRKLSIWGDWLQHSSWIAFKDSQRALLPL